MPGNNPSQAHCEALRDDFGLTMPVLVDWDHRVSAALSLGAVNDWSVVVERGMRLVAKQRYGTDRVFSAIEELLAE